MSNLLQNIELLIWSPATKAEPPKVTAMADALALDGLRSELAEPVPVTTAFRRAVAAREGKGADGSRIKASFLENGKLRGQLDRVAIDADSHRIKREYVAGWTLEDTETGACAGGPG